MSIGSRLLAFRDTRLAQSLLFALGVFLLFIAAPLVSPLPGPGGLLLAAAGLTLVLRTSLWAKRRYVRFKRWQPRAGSWFDWGLRRGSARRREALRKERERQEAPPPSEVPRIDDPLPKGGLELVPIDPTPSEVVTTDPPVAAEAPRH
jgi:hypothetical protein